MAEIILDAQGKPAAPASGQLLYFPDTTALIGCTINPSGIVQARSVNASIADQGAGFATDTYVTGSSLLIPSFGMQAKCFFRWRIGANKTAASTATPVYTIRIGANQTTADTSRLALTGPAQTAATDAAIIEILVTCRSVGVAGVLQGNVSMKHNLTATGFANNVSSVVQGTSAGFDNSALGGSYIGLSINGGASASWTLTQVRSEAVW